MRRYLVELHSGYSLSTGLCYDCGERVVPGYGERIAVLEVLVEELRQALIVVLPAYRVACLETAQGSELDALAGNTERHPTETDVDYRARIRDLIR